jgi:hypothetical protein
MESSGGTARDFGNMINEVTTQKKKKKPKTSDSSPWTKMGTKKGGC